MSSIEQRVAQHLNPTLANCLAQRTHAGTAKYRQRLDDNHQPKEARAVHLIQELLDAAQYAEWLNEPDLTEQLARLANHVQQEYDLSPWDIMTGGKQ